MPRKDYPTIKKGSDGAWHAWVTVGTKGNGRPDQRHVRRIDRAACKERVDELLDQVRTDTVIKAGRGMTATQWLDLYLSTILPSSGRCDPETIRDYRSKIEFWVLPVIGKMRIDRVRTENAEAIYLAMRRAGKADSTVLKVHRILSRAWEIALRRGLVPRNVFKLMDAPSVEDVEMSPLDLEEAEAILAAVAGRRNAARWSVGLALGLRQGEVLGLRWDYIDLDRGEMKVWWQLRRRSFDHGCGGTCGRRRGGNCPQRQLPLRSNESSVLDLSKPADGDRRTGLVLKSPKGKSKRTVPLPVELVEQLRAHRIDQGIERVLAEGVWQDHDLVFARPDGQPIDPATDYREWKALLAECGVPESRLHDGRHTAASIMIALGVPIEVVQEILGHSDVRITRRYAHVASEMARNATQRMGATLLKRTGTDPVHR